MRNWHYSFLAPVIIFIFVVLIAPFILALLLSFTDLNFSIPNSSGSFVGLENYQRAFSDATFFRALLNTCVFVIISSLVTVFFGVAFGLFLYEKIQPSSYLIGVLSIPMMIAPIIIGLAWRLLFQGEFGPISLGLQALGFFLGQSITSNYITALPAVIIVDIWQWFPFVTLLVYIQLKFAPREPFEAATLDGASTSEIRRFITFPFIFPMILITLLLRIMDSFREFDKVFVLTAGGPGNTTELVALYGWRVIFRNWDVGYGAAICILIYLFVLFLTWLLFRLALKPSGRHCSQ